MQAKDYLAIGAGTVAYLVGMFGSALMAAAPPLHPLHPSDQTILIGLMKFIVLFILLAISAGVKLYARKRSRAVWLVLALAGFGTFVYAMWSYGSARRQASMELPNENPPVVVAIGTEFTEAAQAILAQQPDLSKAELLSGFGGVGFITRVWPEASIDASRARFELLYLILVSGIATGLFALVEGVLATGGKAAGK